MPTLILATCYNNELERKHAQVDANRERPPGNRPDLTVEIKKNGYTCRLSSYLNRNWLYRAWSNSREGREISLYSTTQRPEQLWDSVSYPTRNRGYFTSS
jgi:hypothetical protein